MLIFGPLEKVYLELEWYDGPQAGIADLHSVPHRFKAHGTETGLGHFRKMIVFPVEDETLILEQEQWNIFVEWNSLFEAGQVALDSHPGQGGLNPRWDELEHLLAPKRNLIPADAKAMLACFVKLEQNQRY